MKKLRVGLALTGSFCTFDRAISAFEALGDDFDLTAIMSETAFSTDTRFGRAQDFADRLTSLTGREVIHTIAGAEPIGPSGMFDVLAIAPCTGNTLAKLSLGITDSCVTMAAKSHLRNGRPLLVAVSTNDGLAASARSIGTLLIKKNVYFLPFYQDDPANKPTSLVSRYELLRPALEAAHEGRQLQPMIG